MALVALLALLAALTASAMSSAASSSCRVTLPSPSMSPKTVGIDELPPAKVLKSERLYPPDDPLYEPCEAGWTWNNAEAFCVDWMTSCKLTDDNRFEDGKQLCNSQAEHLES
mgnify:CR=1 FL=1